MAEAVSTQLFDSLYNLYLAIALVVGALVVGWLVYNMVRFRERPGDPRPADAPVPGVIPRERGHVIWVYVMAAVIALIMFGLAFGTIGALNFLEHPPEDEERMYVNVVGFQFGWIFEYPDGNFTSINELRVPTDRVVVLNITSRDVWHVFAMIEYRIRTDALPGDTNHLWFKSTEAGAAEIACTQICGTGHALMRAKVVAVTPEAFETWKQSKMPKPAQEDNATGDGARALRLAEAEDLPGGTDVALAAVNAADAPRIMGVGPAEAPYATAEAAAGATVTLSFRTPSGGPVAVWSRDPVTGDVEILKELEVVPQ